MNLYIMADLEGISGIYSRDQIVGNRIDEGRELMTAEINACVDAAKEAGAEKIYVRDCHGSANTIIFNKLSENADYYICGNMGAPRYDGIEDCDAVILLGYHAMAGTANATLEHTFDSTAIQNFWLNGKKIGEAEFDSLGVGEFGKPVIMVSGDDKLCREVNEFLPSAVTCEVKRGMTWNGAMLLPKAKAHKKIAECTKKSIENFKNAKVHTATKPYTLRVELCERGNLPTTSNPAFKIIDGRTYEVTADSVLKLLK